MTTDTSLDIVFVHIDPCIRAEKEAFALTRRGHRVHLFCQGLNFQPNMRDICASVTQYSSLDELGSLLRNHSGFDIVHCHNEPNEPTVVALENTDRPVIYDCHDFRGLRQQLVGHEAETERRCFEDTAAVVHVSQGMVDLAADRYTSHRTMVLPSYPMLTAAPAKPLDKLDGTHVVYLGGLRDRGSIHYEYRNYLPFFEKLIEAGVHVHAYPADQNPKNLATYMALDAQSALFHLHDKLPYAELLQDISQFQWGLSGFNFMDITDENTLLFLNNALPNKLFDYLIGGVCPVVVNCDTSGRWVEEHGLGYHADSMETLVDIVCNRQPKPRLKDFGQVDMLEQVANLESLYRRVLGKE
ncbi:MULTISPECIES: glycosyltransferase [unclassified Pseudodesulfovibrio]|uniref:glycosyltransferase n=1 Tax=unclassified Pseudodesulfovibrio TaxID=2661612 RepID=UPI0013E35BEE|nr:MULTISPECIES: glycosyltransferase [unclassified Pseudodesulfovibrio]MCJ2166244.1 glycosyltransferase [Pseudodesulfovibrio sp. S3-i]